MMMVCKTWFTNVVGCKGCCAVSNLNPTSPKPGYLPQYHNNTPFSNLSLLLRTISDQYKRWSISLLSWNISSANNTSTNSLLRLSFLSWGHQKFAHWICLFVFPMNQKGHKGKGKGIWLFEGLNGNDICV